MEYYLTDFGKTLIPMLEEIAIWGRTLAENNGKMVDKIEKKKKVKSISSGGKQ
ncbi:hypothetical protein D3C83_128480 [compost metagenome]